MGELRLTMAIKSKFRATNVTGCRRDPHDEPQHLRVKSGMVYCPDCQEIISWVGLELEEKLKQRGMKEWKYNKNRK